MHTKGLTVLLVPYLRVFDPFKLTVFRQNKNVLFLQRKPQSKSKHTNPKLHFHAMVFMMNRFNFALIS